MKDLKEKTPNPALVNAFYVLAEMQHKLNLKVNPDWLDAGCDWPMAILVESGELMDHVGWKWWKAQESDLPQARIEAIDILHFGLAMEIEQHYKLVGKTDGADKFDTCLQSVAIYLAKMWEFDQMAGGTISDHVKGVAAHASFVPTIGFHMGHFRSLVELLAPEGIVESSDLVKWMAGLYLGKNVLNAFRQDNGYKEGTYIKVWDGDEDNVYLDKILIDLSMEDIEVKDMPDSIYERLEGYYSSVK